LLTDYGTLNITFNFNYINIKLH